MKTRSKGPLVDGTLKTDLADEAYSGQETEYERENSSTRIDLQHKYKLYEKCTMRYIISLKAFMHKLCLYSFRISLRILCTFSKFIRLTLIFLKLSARKQARLFANTNKNILKNFH